MSGFRFWRLRVPPVFAAVVVTTLALGIGVTSALFSLVDGVLLKPLPYADAEELVMVWESRPDDGVREAGVSYPNLRDWQESAGSLEALVAYQFFPFNLTGVEEPERFWGARISAPLLDVLGVPPQLGRLPRPQEGEAGAQPVVVLSHGLWQRRFGGDRGIVGSTLRLNQQSHTVIGVMPRGFAFPPPLRKGEQTMAVPVELWVPIVPGESEEDRGLRLYFAVGRLARGADPARAQTEMEGIAARLASAYPDDNEGWSARVVPLKEQVVRHVRTSLWLLAAAVGILLSLVCCNLACLFFVRALNRRQELALRSALGAGRSVLAGLLLRESLLLGLAGGLASLLVARGLLSLLSAMASSELPRLDEVGIDLRVLAFTLAVSIVVALAIAVLPAVRLTDPSLGRWLRPEAAGAGGERVRWRGRGLLISLELALALALAVAVGLLGRSFLQLRAVDPGFEPDRLLALELQLPAGSYPGDREVVAFEQRLTDNLAGLPGVERVGAINFPPFSGYHLRLHVTLEDEPPPASPSERPMAQYRVIGPGYLDTVSAKLVNGRGLRTGDDAESARVVLVSETAARHFWPDEDPLGRRIGLQPLAPVARGQPPGEEISFQVVGVVADASQAALDEQPEPLVYVPYLQDPWPFFSLVIRTDGPPEGAIGAVRREIAALDETLAVANVRPLADSVEESTARPRLLFVLLGGFSILAVVLAALGLYGVVSSLMSQRRRELGIRLALGGARSDIVRLVASDLGLFIATGLLAGGALSIGLGRYLESLLYEVAASDPMSFSAAAAAMTLVALVAAGWPVWRAVRSDPIEVLRDE